MGGGELQAGAKSGGSKLEKGSGSDTPVRMDVYQAASANVLRTVTSKYLDTWIMNTLQPSTAFTSQVKGTVRQICEFLKRNCFGDEIRVLKTVKVSAARPAATSAAALPTVPCSPSCPASVYFGSSRSGGSRSWCRQWC